MRSSSNPSFPAANAKEFIALVRANPDKYTFSSSGTGATAHLFAELFNSMAQLKARHVPYKGTVPALTDIMNGQIAYTIETVAATGTHIKAGRLKAYGVSTKARTAAMPGRAAARGSRRPARLRRRGLDRLCRAAGDAARNPRAPLRRDPEGAQRRTI